MLLNSLLTLILVCFILSIAWAVGEKILRTIKIRELSPVENAIFGLPAGIGVIASGVFYLGITGHFSTWPFLAWLLILGVWSSGELVRIANILRGRLASLFQYTTKTRLELRAISLCCLLILILTFIQALTPPWDADGLIYHLQVPRMWLQQGGIKPIPQFWEANYPMNIEMLFAVGLAFGSEPFSKLIHLVFALILLTGVFTFSRRFLSPQYAWLAPVLLLGIPIFPLWASSSYTDIGWAVFEFFSLYALILWWKTNNRGFLILGGVLVGMATASKYPALSTLAILGLGVLWYSRRLGYKTILSNGAIFGLSAFLFGAPWYIKNLVWFHNPIFPLSFGEMVRPGGPENLWMTYMWEGFGTGEKFIDYLLIPVNLFVHRERFGTFAGNIEIPSPLFLLVLVYPFLKKTRELRVASLFTLFRFISWSVGVQQTRLLLPLFPWFSLITSEVITTLGGSVRSIKTGRILAVGLAGGMLATTLIYCTLLFVKTSPLGVITGWESRSSFLTRMVDDYSGVRYIQERLPSNARVLMMWDGRGYYCDQRCLPDSDHSQWTSLVLNNRDVSAIATELGQQGVTHLFLSKGDADFILQHDPKQQHLKALTYFMDIFQPRCTQKVYQDAWTEIYQLTCPETALADHK